MGRRAYTAEEKAESKRRRKEKNRLNQRRWRARRSELMSTYGAKNQCDSDHTTLSIPTERQCHKKAGEVLSGTSVMNIEHNAEVNECIFPDISVSTTECAADEKNSDGIFPDTSMSNIECTIEEEISNPEKQDEFAGNVYSKIFSSQERTPIDHLIAYIGESIKSLPKESHLKASKMLLNSFFEVMRKFQ